MCRRRANGASGRLSRTSRIPKLSALTACARSSRKTTLLSIAFDQEAWTRNLDYARRKPKQSLESFRRVRGENYELLKELPEAAYGRTGNHSERGPITLRFQLELLAEHAESHARQMQAIREEYKKAKGKK